MLYARTCFRRTFRSRGRRLITPPESARFEWRRPLFRAPLESPSEPQPIYNEPLTPVSAQRAFFGPLAPLMRREPNPHSPTAHNPQPSGDADLSFVRHQRPPLTDKPR